MSVANDVLSDFEATSGFFEPRSKEPQGKTIGRFGIGVDPTPILVAVIAWVLKSVLDEFKERRKRAKRKPITLRPLTAAERQEIRELVVDFGRSLGDREILTPEATDKWADSVERVIAQNPQLLLHRDEADGE